MRGCLNSRILHFYRISPFIGLGLNGKANDFPVFSLVTGFLEFSISTDTLKGEWSQIQSKKMGKIVLF